MTVILATMAREQSKWQAEQSEDACTAGGAWRTVIHQHRGGTLAMPTYILLSHLTDEGRKTLRERPERLSEVNQEVEAMGAKIRAQYALLGAFDFVNIIEAPNNETMVRISIELGLRGTIRMHTYAAVEMAAFASGLASARSK
jgi:uncharacterized protein with GYD domain